MEQIVEADIHRKSSDFIILATCNRCVSFILWQNGDAYTLNIARDFITEVVSSFQCFKSGKLIFDASKNLKNEIIDKLDLGNK